MTDDYNVRNAVIELIDNIKFKVDCDEELRRRMAFTWEHLQDVDRFNLFMVGLMVMGLVKEWRDEKI